MNRSARWFLGGSIAMVAALSSAFAQQPTRVRGTVEKIDGSTLTVRAGEANEVKLNLTDGAQVYGVVKASIADIKPGVYVGVGAMPQTDGSQKAIQVMIFAESMRGIGEGHRPWDRPGSTMTNGTVDATVGSVDGQAFTVKYKDGEKKIVVTPELSDPRLRDRQPGRTQARRPSGGLCGEETGWRARGSADQCRARRRRTAVMLEPERRIAGD